MIRVTHSRLTGTLHVDCLVSVWREWEEPGPGPVWREFHTGKYEAIAKKAFFTELL